METPLALVRRVPALRRCLQRNKGTVIRPFPAAVSSSRAFSTNEQPKDTKRKPPPPLTAAAAATGENGHSQPFVQTRITAGEWDPARTNPLYRPKYKSRAKIVSAEDYADRPGVGFFGEFDTFQDAMVTLTWLDQADHQQIYQLYTDLLSHSQEKHGVTSHEYVVRVIAQKYNITAERVAAIVQLQHNEEQILKEDPDRVLLNKAANYMDDAVKQEIQEAYQTFGLKKPDEFVEDPVGVSGSFERASWQVVNDVLDVDQIMEDTIVREDRQVRLQIDGHHYQEDVDDATVAVPMSKQARKLLQAKEKFAKQRDAAAKQDVVDWPVNHVKPRARWTFVAQTVNTRELKKKRAPASSYTNNSVADTLVEEPGGTLRAATLEDVKLTAWKPVRHVQEHTFAGAKRGWLDRTIRGKEQAWGKAPPKPVKPPVVKEVAAPVEKEEKEADAKDAAVKEVEAEKKKASADDDSSSDDDRSSSSDDDEDTSVEDSSSSDEDEDEEDEGTKKEDKDDESK